MYKIVIKSKDEDLKKEGGQRMHFILLKTSDCPFHDGKDSRLEIRVDGTGRREGRSGGMKLETKWRQDPAGPC